MLFLMKKIDMFKKIFHKNFKYKPQKLPVFSNLKINSLRNIIFFLLDQDKLFNTSKNNVDRSNFRLFLAKNRWSRDSPNPFNRRFNFEAWKGTKSSSPTCDGVSPLWPFTKFETN